MQECQEKCRGGIAMGRVEGKVAIITGAESPTEGGVFAGG